MGAPSFSSVNTDFGDWCERYVESLEARLEKMDKLLTKVCVHAF